MYYGIGRDHKLGKKNRKQLDNTTDPSSEPPTPSFSDSKLNENTHITSKKSLNSETHSRIFFAIDDKPSIIIQNKYASKPYSKDTLISIFSVDDDSKLFETPIKIITVSLH